MVQCGSREAAMSEAFYATGANGWSIAFTCAVRLGEGFDDENGNAQRVEKFGKLAEEDVHQDDDTVRVFY
jgi:hypothetical protein